MNDTSSNIDELQQAAEDRLALRLVNRPVSSVFDMIRRCVHFIRELILLERKTEFRFETPDGTHITISYEQAQRRFGQHLKKIAELEATETRELPSEPARKYFDGQLVRATSLSHSRSICDAELWKGEWMYRLSNCLGRYRESELRPA